MPRADPREPRFHRRLTVAALVAAAIHSAPLPAHVVASAPVFINEIHYRNAGPDRHEAVELAGIAGLSLNGWQLILYEGGGGRVYHTRALHGVIPDQQGGFGTLLFTYSTGVLADDGPHGVALVDAGGRVVQLLSYGGAFAATEGPARDLGSTNIALSQGPETPPGHSLQLTGSGTHYADFRWQEPAPASYGIPNPGQTFAPGGAIPAQTLTSSEAVPEVAFSTQCPSELRTGVGIPAALTLSAVDPDGVVSSARLKGVLAGGISLGAFRASAAPGEPASAVLLVAATVPPGIHRLEVEFAADGGRRPRSASCVLQVIVGAGPQTAAEPYYRGTGGQAGPELKAALHRIVRTGHRPRPYEVAREALMEADQDVTDPGRLALFYTGRAELKSRSSGRDARDFDAWRPTHLWPVSRGLGDTGTPGPATDLHNLRAADASVAFSRGDRDLDGGGAPHHEAPGTRSDADSWEPRDAVKGDIARALFYMAVRYEGEAGEPDLELVDRTAAGGGALGRLCTLLTWHARDPVDGVERRRNDVVSRWQGNRNPFVDNPRWARSIWGGQCPGAG